MTIDKQFRHYVSRNIIGMLGLSAYVLADTIFISIAAGADGITALNLVLPVYSLIFAIGSMIAVGSATRFKIFSSSTHDSERASSYFFNGVGFSIIFGLVFVAIGIFAPGQLMMLLGASKEIVDIGTIYTRIFMLFAPVFMLNYVFNAFVRNDNDPTLSMTATFSSSIFNIVMDYVLMFPLHMGMAGAALATALSPVVGILICSIHFCSGKNTIHFQMQSLSLRELVNSCKLGISAFVGEMSGGITTMIFNVLILQIAGNIGVAAYGVIANISIVAVSIFNGISQGAQPLFSGAYGRGDNGGVKRLLRLSVMTALGAAIIMVLTANLIPHQIVGIFNSGESQQMEEYALEGVRLYFLGLLFSGFNIVGTGYLSATARAGWSFVISILRGFVAIALFAVVLSMLFGMRGVWLAYPAAEGTTALVMLVAIFHKTGKKLA